MKRSLPNEGDQNISNDIMHSLTDKVAAIMEIDHKNKSFNHQPRTYDPVPLQKFQSDNKALKERAEAGFYSPREDLGN